MNKRLRGLLIIDKRYPGLVIPSAIVTCLNLAIVHPVLIWIIYNPEYDEIFGKWWFYLSISISNFTYQIVPIIENCRIWLIAFDLQYLHSSRNQQWKTEIDASYADKDWYLKNKGTWGDQQYVARVAFLYYIVTSTVFTIVTVLGLDESMIAVQAIWTFVNIGVPLYLYMKTPRNLQEKFLFKFEFTWTIIIASTAPLLFIIGQVFIQTNSWTTGWTVLFVYMMYSLWPSLLSTLLIPYKVSAMAEWNEAARTPKLKMQKSSCNFMQKLKELLKDEHKCEAFIHWMHLEFSSETILSFLEFVQFRKYAKGEIKKTDDLNTAGAVDRFDFELYDGMPRSTIVYNTSCAQQEVTPVRQERIASSSDNIGSIISPSENALVRCKRIVHLFFRKYIDYHSVHEVNISGPLRNAEFVTIHVTPPPIIVAIVVSIAHISCAVGFIVCRTTIRRSINFFIVFFMLFVSLCTFPALI